MTFQPPLNMPNGLPTASPTTTPGSFLPPQTTKANLSQHFPPQYQIHQPQTQQYQPPQPLHNHQTPPPQQPQPPLSQQQHQPQAKQPPPNLLTNGSSNASSRTASPAPNQSVNQHNYAPPTAGNLHQQQLQQKLVNQPATSQYLPSNQGSYRPQTTNVSSASQQPPGSQVNHFPSGPPTTSGQNLPGLTTGLQNMSITNGLNGNSPAPPMVNGNYSAPNNPAGPPRPPTTQQSQIFNGQATRPPAQYGAVPQNALPPQPQPSSFNPINQPKNPIFAPQRQLQPPLAPTNTVQSPPGPTGPPGPPGPPINNAAFPPTTTNNAPPPAGLPKRPAYPQAAFQQTPPPPVQQQYPQYPQQPQQPQQHQQYPPQPQQYNQQPTPPNPQKASFNGQPMAASSSAAPLQYQNQFNNFDGSPKMQPGSTVQHGFNQLWGHQNIDLMQSRHVLPQNRVQPPTIDLGHEFFESVNCSPDILRCTLTKIPETSSLLQKSRLPLGILIHPYRDLNNLPVIQCSAIVRCRTCRTYINPFVNFVDSKKWRCNLCYRVNELPDEFHFDPVTKSYGDVMRRPEVKSSTIEFIAPSEYMLRPPQPAIYLFLLDVSQIAQQTGYLDVVCASLSENLDNLRGDARTQVGFIAYNSAVHFYSIAEGFNQPHEITVVDIDDPFLPCPDNLLINLRDCKELIRDLLMQLPTRFANSYDSNSALGSALQIATKLMHQSGGRVTVFQTCLPNIGPGSLKPRENPNDRSAKEIQHLGPATDFYKRLALECSGQQIAVDLFVLNSQYCDLATLSGISKFSGGCMHHFPLFSKAKEQQVELLNRTMERYITRKIGFESVMRVRCTRGLAIHTFHGNFFVRSTDLLSLPNVNPDAGFGMQISYDESLSDTKTICFQAALLYTSSKGERRIRVHTLCLPVTASLSDVMHSADQQAIIGLISKMAVDRSLQSNIGDARDAFINASVDVFSAFRVAQNLPSGASSGQLVVPRNLSLLPLYMMALLKHMAFRTGTSTRLDDRVFAMCELKTLPLDQLIRNIYPDFYLLDELFVTARQNEGNDTLYEPPLLQLSAEKLDSRSVFLLDNGPNMFIFVGTNVPTNILQAVFGISNVSEIPDISLGIPSTGTLESNALLAFIDLINAEKPFAATIQIIRDTSPYRSTFTEKLVDDRSESSLSYYEFLQHLRTQVK